MVTIILLRRNGGEKKKKRVKNKISCKRRRLKILEKIGTMIRMTKIYHFFFFFENLNLSLKIATNDSGMATQISHD